jgi:hypothetical protein
MDTKDLVGGTGHQNYRDGSGGKSEQETLAEGESFFLYLFEIKMTGVGLPSCRTGPPHCTPRTI